VRWLSAILLLAIVAFSAPRVAQEIIDHDAISAIDSLLHARSIPEPRFELRRPTLLSSVRAGELETPAWYEQLRAPLVSISRPLPLQRFRLRRHVPRMSSDDPDLS
jgi:hypothetical protein